MKWPYDPQVSEHFQHVAEFVQQYYPPVDIDRVLEIPHFPLWNESNFQPATVDCQLRLSAVHDEIPHFSRPGEGSCLPPKKGWMKLQFVHFCL